MRWVWLLLFTLAACSGEGSVTAEQYPDMRSPEFHVYSQSCSACHAPPQPTAHTASEWPSVIARMQNHRIQRALGPIMAGEMAKVRSYLTAHARKEGT